MKCGPRPRHRGGCAVARLQHAGLQRTPYPVLLGAVLLGESVTAGLLIGAPFVLAGVYVGALAPGAREAPAASSGVRRD